MISAPNHKETIFLWVFDKYLSSTPNKHLLSLSLDVPRTHLETTLTTSESVWAPFEEARGPEASERGPPREGEPNNARVNE